MSPEEELDHKEPEMQTVFHRKVDFDQSLKDGSNLDRKATGECVCMCVCACVGVSTRTRIVGCQLLISGSKSCKCTEMKRLKAHLGNNENTCLFEGDGLYMVNDGI